MESFQQVLKNLYAIHMSRHNLIPIERFIQNIIDEVPLPDQGNILVQTEIG